MSLLSDHERKILILEYETLHKEIWERGGNVWLVNSILITGSLIITFTIQFPTQKFLTPMISLVLVIIAFMINATTDQVTKITYHRMERIGQLLGMTGPTLMYHIEIEGKWWYSIRRNLPYVLYLVMASTYLSIILGDTGILWVILVFAAGVLIMLMRELLSLVRRWIRQSGRSV